MQLLSRKTQLYELLSQKVKLSKLFVLVLHKLPLPTSIRVLPWEHLLQLHATPKLKEERG
jgi:hypothetical protein